MDIERLFQQGDTQTAYSQAEALLKKTLQAGSTAYHGAPYDIALAHCLFGRISNEVGLAEDALKLVQQAQQGLQVLADEGDHDASMMVAGTLIEQGNCLIGIGRLDSAVEFYQQAIKLDEKQGNKRGVAVGKLQLANARLLLGDYEVALAACAECRKLISKLNEPQSLAVAWYRSGMVYRRMQSFEQAEQAFRQALAINSKQCNKTSEADSLNELGNLYNAWGKLEQAVVFYRQAVNIYQLGDKCAEGVSRTNIAGSLIKLQRYDEARSELQRAIECKKAFRHSTEPWKTWMTLHDLEQASDNLAAAHAAKQQAIQSYLAYRRAGGQNMSGSHVPQWCQETLRAIHENSTVAAEKELLSFQDDEDLSDYLKPVIPKLIALLQGERNPTLADDPELDYNNAAELLLLLEAL